MAGGYAENQCRVEALREAPGRHVRLFDVAAFLVALAGTCLFIASQQMPPLWKDNLLLSAPAVVALLAAALSRSAITTLMCTGASLLFVLSFGSIDALFSQRIAQFNWWLLLPILAIGLLAQTMSSTKQVIGVAIAAGAALIYWGTILYLGHEWPSTLADAERRAASVLREELKHGYHILGPIEATAERSWFAHGHVGSYFANAPYTVTVRFRLTGSSTTGLAYVYLSSAKKDGPSAGYWETTSMGKDPQVRAMLGGQRDVRWNVDGDETTVERRFFHAATRP